jgi:hypothetical protein
VRLLGIIRLTKCYAEPLDIIGELECEDVHKDKRPEKKRKESCEKPKHVQSAGTKRHVGHELPPKHQKVRRKR